MATVDAAQPKIVVIDEGARIDFSPKMFNDDQLDLRRRLTLSAIDDVRNVKLPGQDVTVQSPKVTGLAVSTTCRLKQGESLLVGSPGEDAFYYAITPSWFSDPVATDDNVEHAEVRNWRADSPGALDSQP